MMRKQQKEVEEKIKKIKKKIQETQNSCNMLAREEMESLNSDILYLSILEKDLAEFHKKF